MGTFYSFMLVFIEFSETIKDLFLSDFKFIYMNVIFVLCVFLSICANLILIISVLLHVC